MTATGITDHATTPAIGGRLDSRRWDLLVVGGGTAGIVGARTAARLAADVLLVEEDRTGGDCLWTGCVPSKALLAAAHAATDARAARRFGIDCDQVRVDFPAVRRHVRSAIDAIRPADEPGTLTAAGIRVIHGRARFTASDRAEITVDAGQPVTVGFRQALIATGSAPVVPPVPGLNGIDALTSDTVWDLPELPARLLVLGGGSAGCELGQAFARLGSQVTLVEAGPRILPRESPDVATVLAEALRADGIDLRTRARVRGAGRGDDGIILDLGGDRLRGDALLVATGRRPRTGGLGLTAAGITTTASGHVRVDAALRTSNPRVYAAGDVTGHPQLTHVAGVHGSVAAANAVLGLRRRAETAIVPRVTFTQPEIAAFGVSAAAAAADPRLQVCRMGNGLVDRAVTDDRTGGFTELVLDRRDRIVGATVVGPRAGELLPELTLAARQGLRTGDIAGVIHAYPTYADGPWKASIARVQEQLADGATGRAIAVLLRARRWWHR